MDVTYTSYYCSITIDDVVYVVDAGKIKETTYDVSRNITCLDPVWISQASAKQRQGRAGRCALRISIYCIIQLF